MQTESAPPPTALKTGSFAGKTSALASIKTLIGSLLDALADVAEPAVARFSRTRRWIAVETEDGDLAIYRSSGTRNTLLGHAGTLDEKARRMLRGERSSEIELRLAPQRVIQTSIKVPSGGLDYIEQIIDSRLDRLTPWQPEKVLSGFSRDARPGADGQFDIDIAATSAEIAATGIRRLDALGLAPSALGSAAEPLTQSLKIDLFRGRNNNARKARRRRIAILAAVGLALSALVYAGSLYAVSAGSQNLIDLDRQMTDARRMLVQGSGTMAERQKDLDLISQKTPGCARFALIDRLSLIIPDNTYLDELEIQPGILRIAGTSTEASALIKILESEPSVASALFTAPVTRQDDGRDRFDITAVFKGRKVEPTQ